jgi:hypothetical protein
MIAVVVFKLDLADHVFGQEPLTCGWKLIWHLKV